MRRIQLLMTGLAVACAGPKHVHSPAAPPPTPVVVTPPTGPQPGESVAEYDLTHGGRPDLRKYTMRGPDGKDVLVRKERDLNGDGKIDAWEYYNPNGTLAKLVYDLDFDGKPDVSLFFEKDQLVKREYAFGFDGVPHAWNYYEKGKLVRKERDTNGDGKVDYWEYWENGAVDRIGVDVDGDGQVDQWESRRTAEAQEADGPAVPAPGARDQK